VLRVFFWLFFGLSLLGVVFLYVGFVIVGGWGGGGGGGGAYKELHAMNAPRSLYLLIGDIVESTPQGHCARWRLSSLRRAHSVTQIR